MGAAVRAQLTVTFVGLKRGLFTCDGPDCAGRVVFDPLGLPSAIYNAIEFSGYLIRENIISELLKPRQRNAHKGDYGHVLVVGGQPGMSGAPRLAGEAALRGGAGLVSVATDADHARHLNTARPELMVHACATVQDLSALLTRATVLAVGPGLGTGSWAQAMLDHCLAEEKPLVLDADALNLLARKPERRRPRGAPWILTPHPAEAARLLDTETRLVQSDRVGRALEIAERFDAIVVLKGCGSIVADPHGRYAICPLGNPGMATAGSGDVLTGVISAMLAQGLDGWQAACLGVTAHAAAGDFAAGRLGERSLLAGDITDHLHAVLR